MRKLIQRAALVVAVSLLTALSALSQSQSYPQKWFFASDYGQWQIVGQTPNSYTFLPISACQVPAPSTGTFFPFATNAPVEIVDVNSANSEVVTPSAVTPSATNPSSSSCGITVSPAHQHYNFRLQSGTAGLQEVLNQISATNAFPAVVWLDRQWYTAASAIPGTTPAAIIADAQGNSAVRLVDDTTTPFQYYAWNGSNYVIVGTATGGSSMPTVAAGAAAGTSPTIANASGGNGSTLTVNLTEGTAPTTGTLFTETWATSNAFTYEPSCTVTNTGANTLDGITAAVTYPSGTHALLTVTAGSAPTASTAYAFQVNCR